MTTWKLEVCGQDMPQELELVSPDTYIQRDLIQLVTPEEDGERGEGAVGAHYECYSRFITVAEYNQLNAIEQIETNQAIDEYTMALIEEGIL